MFVIGLPVFVQIEDAGAAEALRVKAGTARTS